MIHTYDVEVFKFDWLVVFKNICRKAIHGIYARVYEKLLGKGEIVFVRNK